MAATVERVEKLPRRYDPTASAEMRAAWEADRGTRLSIKPLPTYRPCESRQVVIEDYGHSRFDGSEYVSRQCWRFVVGTAQGRFYWVYDRWTQQATAEMSRDLAFWTARQLDAAHLQALQSGMPIEMV